MKNREKTDVGAGGRYGWRGVLRMVWALPLVFAACPGVVVAAGEKSGVSETQRQATERPAEFVEFQRILRGYPELVMISCIGEEIILEAEKTPEQFEKDVAAYVVKKDESGYIREEEGDYAKLVQEMKILRLAVSRVSEKAEVLHDALLRFARKSVQTALNNEASLYTNGEYVRLTPEKAEEAFRAFSLEALRMFAQDLLAFRCHSYWLDLNVREESVNRAPRSIAVSQYLSCNGPNGEIVMSTAAARGLWTRQVEMAEGDLFTLSDSWDNEHADYTDPISRFEWMAPREKAKKDFAALQQEWAGVKTAYDAYMRAWEDAYAPVPSYSGSGIPYWCADMCMHMLSHWEELVSYMLFRNTSRFISNAENRDCFLLSLPGKEADEFADIYMKKLSIALKLAADEEESEQLDVVSEADSLREPVARLYDARMRCAIAGISCEFYGNAKRIAEETEKARKIIRENMLQDIVALCCGGCAKTDEQRRLYTSKSDADMELWRKQMRLLLTAIGESYEDSENPEPFCGERNPVAPRFSDTHVKRIQDLLEETEAAWNWYRRGWIWLSCNLTSVDIHSVYTLHALREQWLHFLYSRSVRKRDDLFSSPAE